MYPAVAIAHQLLMALKMVLDFLQVTGYGFVFLFLSLGTELKTWTVSLQCRVFLYWWTTGGEACLNKCWQHCVIFTGLLSRSAVYRALGVLSKTLSYMGRNLWALNTMRGFQWYCQQRVLSSRWWIIHCQQIYMQFKYFGCISNLIAEFQKSASHSFLKFFEHAGLALKY